ncbi:uncharacterized protein V6R79_023700 [Siganus canaliculatus]
MHLRLFAAVISLLCELIRMGSGAVQRQSAQRETSDDCRGCLECSRDNGCVRCPERLFLFLQREGMSHHGTCVHACPAGHYGQRGKDVSRCMKCRSADCEHCFSRDFCTKCKPGFQLHKGKCLSSCPPGTFAHHTDCLDDCVSAPLGEWSQWSVCLRDGAECGFRWGKQTRTRTLTGASPSGRTLEEKASAFCPSHSETQRCRMKKKCPTELLFVLQNVTLCVLKLRNIESNINEATSRVAFDPKKAAVAELQNCCSSAKDRNHSSYINTGTQFGASFCFALQNRAVVVISFVFHKQHEKQRVAAVAADASAVDASAADASAADASAADASADFSVQTLLPSLTVFHRRRVISGVIIITVVRSYVRWH